MNTLKVCLKGAVMAMAVGVGVRASAATINFLATEDNDLANTANWSSPTWTSADTLLVSTSNFTMPEAGLRLSADLPASDTLKFGSMPNKNVTVDFGGHKLNTAKLLLDSMHDDANRNYYIKATGGFSGVTMLQADIKGHIRFYDGEYRIKNTFILRNWFPYVYVCSGSHVIVEEVIKNAGESGKFVGVFLHNDTSNGQFIIDGGRFTVLKHSDNDYNWRRVMWKGNGSNLCDVQILNGGIYDDPDDWPSTEFSCAPLLIRDSAYYATNAINHARNTEFVRSASKTIANSIFRTAQLFCGPSHTLGNTILGTECLSNTTVDFCDSEVTLLYPPSADQGLSVRAGFAAEEYTRKNTFRFRGPKNRFTTQTFALGSISNTVEISGGTFDVSNQFVVAASDGAKVTVSDTRAYLKTLAFYANATNSVFTFASGAVVTGGGEFGIGGRNGTMTVEKGAKLDLGANYLKFTADDTTLAVGEDVSLTGSVYFTANNSRVFLGSGAHLSSKLGPGWSRVWPLRFTEGKANNVLVLSNATYQGRSPFYVQIVKTVEGPESDAIPFTNCPNSRIEFRGTTPKFVVTSAQECESSGRAWYGMALGEMIDHEKNSWTSAHYLLKDPVRVRYVLPTEGYAEAPLQCLDNAIVLGGNAEFEFDVSNFTWPEKKMVIPLVYNPRQYLGWNFRSYVNVAQLNKTNADRLPVSPSGKKATLQMSADGTTLNLVLRGESGLVILVR